MFLRFLKGEFQKLPFTPFETIVLVEVYSAVLTLSRLLRLRLVLSGLARWDRMPLLPCTSLLWTSSFRSPSQSAPQGWIYLLMGSGVLLTEPAPRAGGGMGAYGAPPAPLLCDGQ